MTILQAPNERKDCGGRLGVVSVTESKPRTASGLAGRNACAHTSTALNATIRLLFIYFCFQYMSVSTETLLLCREKSLVTGLCYFGVLCARVLVRRKPSSLQPDLQTLETSAPRPGRSMGFRYAAKTRLYLAVLQICNSLIKSVTSSRSCQLVAYKALANQVSGQVPGFSM